MRVPKYSAAALVEYTAAIFSAARTATLATLAYTFVGDRDDFTPTGDIANHGSLPPVRRGFSYSPGIRWRALRDEALVVQDPESARPPLLGGVRVSGAADQFPRGGEARFLSGGAAKELRTSLIMRFHALRVEPRISQRGDGTATCYS